MVANVGSSPLARGLPTLVDCLDGPERIIPARAGFTGRRGRGRVPTLDHPRSRGVYLQVIPQQAMTPGSSPLARGLPPRGGEGRARRGIIPARAGFTRRSRSSPPARGDHPRSRGVYAQSALSYLSANGSSPLARGLPRRRQAKNTDNGIIPARAGFTTGSFSTAWRARGSSPLARGLRFDGVFIMDYLRIIPARAGFTCETDSRHRSAPDHPRSRGVYMQMYEEAANVEGSSPLARGLQADAISLRLLVGIIPARAGFTVLYWSYECCQGDHPRSRGVYWSAWIALSHSSWR